MMKEKIISKATDLFLKLGFKSVTMDDLASEMCISKKTIYKYFCNKELLIDETTQLVHQTIQQNLNNIIAQGWNAIEENFKIQRMFSELFQSSETSPAYQLKKHYPEIYDKIMTKQQAECGTIVRLNIEKGIREGFYRKDLLLDIMIDFYFTLVMGINSNTISEKEVIDLELKALEYHTRAIATPKGIMELEKQLLNYYN